MLRAAVVLGLVAGLALSPKLWLSSRLYPLTPVFSFPRPFPSPFDWIVFGGLILLLLVPRRAFAWAAIGLMVVLALQDQSRWQPWFYQYGLMLVAITIGPEERAMNTCRLIVAATYVWSGLAKLNPVFFTDSFPFLIAPFLGGRRIGGSPLVTVLAVAAALVECAIGLGLLTRRFRRPALSGAVAMHVLILISIGPPGHASNLVVWPWNLAMIALLFLLFWRGEQEPAARDIVWGRGFAFQRVVLVIFAMMPALSFFNLWDDYLSSSLYSGNRNSGVIYMTDDVFDRLPEPVQDYVTDEGENRGGLDINDWSYGEMNVPFYPEVRIYKNVTRRICAYTADGSGVELVVQRKLALIGGGRRSVYRCSDLNR